jgi:hypothetical protein
MTHTAWLRCMILTVGAVLPTACTSVTPEGAQVRVTDNLEVVRGCEFIGNVKYLSDYVDGDETLVRMLNDAGRLGGNVLYLDTRIGALHMGEVYRCER